MLSQSMQASVNGLTVDELFITTKILTAREQEGLEHHTDDSAVARRDLIGEVLRNHGLANRVLAAVVVRGVDHDPLRLPEPASRASASATAAES